MKLLEWICLRCPLRDRCDECEHERRKVSAEGRRRWEVFTQEKAEIEQRLALVDMQAKVIDHVTGHKSAIS